MSLWERDDATHLPKFVDKALKLLNLKQVAFEIENSLLSKVSCTACKAGNYLKQSKKYENILRIIYLFQAPDFFSITLEPA